MPQPDPPRLPDPAQSAKARAGPAAGPRPLFLSGGTALTGIAQALKAYTHNSIHLITPFDSGGSSQVLREALDMPAVGDLRNRFVALADDTAPGQAGLLRLVAYRFAKAAPPDVLLAEFDRLLAGQHDLLAGLSHVKRAQVLALLNAFDAARPDSFAFAGASIGNLVMAGSYVTEGQQIGPALRATARLIGVQGTVRPIVDGAFGLGADLADGSRVAGQRDLTGKEVAPPAAPIRRLFLTDHGQELPPKAVPLPPGNRALIQSADLICYAPGSFFTSVLANLLPQGVGQAIAARDVPKLYLPSLGDDPEARGMRLPDRIDRLLQMLRADAGPDCLDDQLVSLILCDADAVSAAEAAACAVPVRRLPLRNPARPERYAPSAVCEALLSLM